MFKVFVDVGEKDVHTNALEFSDVEAAKEYGRDLYGRWMLVRRWFVLEDQGSHVPLDVAEREAVARSDAGFLETGPGQPMTTYSKEGS